MIGGPALLTAHPAERDSTQIAASFGVNIVWAKHSPCELQGDVFLGCFTAATPNTIYVAPDMSDANEYYIVLHEIGHVLQHRLGNMQDECAADRFAQSMRSNLGMTCPPVADNPRN
jgi:Zn-dependent peptidase ImmA (M78 family)